MICTKNTSAMSEQCSLLMELMAIKCVQLLTRHFGTRHSYFVRVCSVAFMGTLIGIVVEVFIFPS